MTDRWVADWEPSPRFPHYTRANAGEVMPDPVSPLGWSLAWEEAVGPGWRDGNIEFGAYTEADLDPRRPEIIGLFGGHLYVGLSACRLVGVRMPGLTVDLYDYAAFGGHADVPPYVPHPDDEDDGCTDALAKRLEWVMSVQDWPELTADRERAEELRRARPDLRVLDEAALLARAREMIAPLRQGFARHVVSTLGSTIGPGAIAGICAEAGDPTAANRLIGAIGDVDSAVPARRLWDLSRKVRTDPALAAAFEQGDPTRLADFLAEHGCRGPNVWDLRSATWELDPRTAIRAVLLMSAVGDEGSPQHRFDAAAADRETVLAAMDLGDEQRTELAAATASAVRFLAWRERTKTTAVMVLHEMRMPLWELGRRAVERGVLEEPRDITLLMAGELDEFVDAPDDFRTVLADRKQDYLELFELEPPFIIAGAKVPPLADWPRRSRPDVDVAGPGTQLRGLPGSAGTARGLVRVARTLDEAGDLQPGEILVCRTTDPSWTPLFVPAAAVVVETGAQISHAVIVSRELGVPCVISAVDATVALRTGAEVEVDGTQGTVTVLADPS